MSNREDDQKNCKNSKVILLESIKDSKIELDEQELELKSKLAYIEDKLESVKKVIGSIGEENKETLYNSDAFDALVGSIAITAAINTIAEYFNIKLDDIDSLIK